MKPVIVTVEATASASAEAAFAGVVPIDLTAAFTGWGPFPAVTGVEHQPGAWDAAGKTRTVVLSGGGIMRERMVEYASPIRCAYEVIPHQGPLKRLVERINGQFVFRELHHGKTEISWSYEFIPRRRTRPLLLLLAPLWRRYATQILARFVEAAEQAEAARDRGRARPRSLTSVRTVVRRARTADRKTRSIEPAGVLALSLYIG